MQRPHESARKGSSPSAVVTPRENTAQAKGNALIGDIVRWLDDAKAEDIVVLEIGSKSSLGDAMVVATGRTDRHVGAIADRLVKEIKERGVAGVRVEGQRTCDWVLVDAGSVIVHVFRPEVRAFYNLEKMWSADRPEEAERFGH